MFSRVVLYYVTPQCCHVVCISYLSLLCVYALPLTCCCHVLCYLLLYFMLVTVAGIHITYSLLSCIYLRNFIVMILLFSDFYNSSFQLLDFTFELNFNLFDCSFNSTALSTTTHVILDTLIYKFSFVHNDYQTGRYYHLYATEQWITQVPQH